MNFFGGKWADGADWQLAEPDGSYGDSTQLLHLMADAGEKAAHFAVAAFVQNHFEDRRLLLVFLDAHVFSVGISFGQVDASVELGEYGTLNAAGHLHLINLFDTMPRMRETVGKFTVVGDENQAFAVNIKPTYGEHPWRVGRHEVGNAVPAGRVAGRAHHASRFVDGKIHELLSRECLAVDADFLLLRIDARTKLSDNFAIDFDPPLANELFALAPAGDSRGGENLLQAFTRFVRRLRITIGARGG